MLETKDSPPIKLKNDDSTNGPTISPNADETTTTTTTTTQSTTTTTSPKKDEITTTTTVKSTLENMPVSDHDHRNQPPSPG